MISNSNFINYERVRHYQGKFDLMTGEDFEQYCGILLNELGFSNIKFTPKSKDHGIDILATIIDSTFSIQCKCSIDPIGVSAIRDVFAGKFIYKSDVAVVMTNSSFTEQAKEEADILGVKLWGREHICYLTDTYYFPQNKA